MDQTARVDDTGRGMYMMKLAFVFYSCLMIPASSSKSAVEGVQQRWAEILVQHRDQTKFLGHAGGLQICIGSNSRYS